MWICTHICDAYILTKRSAIKMITLMMALKLHTLGTVLRIMIYLITILLREFSESSYCRWASWENQKDAFCILPKARQQERYRAKTQMTSYSEFFMTSYSVFSAVYQFETTETRLCEMKLPRLTLSRYTRLTKTINSNLFSWRKDSKKDRGEQNNEF